MKRYLFLILKLFRYSLMRDFEFRFNLISWSIVNIVWGLLLIVSTDLVFGQVDNIAGVGREVGRMIVVTYTLFWSLFGLFLWPSLTSFSRLIRHGGLDFYLSKPVSKRFLVTFNRFEFDNILRLILAFAFLIFLANSQNFGLGFWQVTKFLILLFEGLVAFYNVFYFLITLNFWAPNLFNLSWLIEVFAESGRFPIKIYTWPLSLFVTFVIPMAFVATFPVRALINENVNWEILYGGIVIAIGFLITEMFWNFAIKRYSSASS